MSNRDRLYVEMHCTSCKRNHMISREAATDRATVKKCPHCLSPKVGPTGMLGFTATNTEIKSAVEKGLGIAKEIDDEQVADTIDEMRRTIDDHQKDKIAATIDQEYRPARLVQEEEDHRHSGGEPGAGDDGASGDGEHKEPELPHETVLNPAEDKPKHASRSKTRHH